MGPYSRIEADLDLDEEAELRRLEAGDPSYPDEEAAQSAYPAPPSARPPSAPPALSGETLLFRCAASHPRGAKDTPTGGQLRLFPDRIEFAAHGAAASVVLPLASVSAFRQSKPAAGAVMAKVARPGLRSIPPCFLSSFPKPDLHSENLPDLHRACRCSRCCHGQGRQTCVFAPLPQTRAWVSLPPLVALPHTHTQARPSSIKPAHGSLPPLVASVVHTLHNLRNSRCLK